MRRGFLVAVVGGWMLACGSGEVVVEEGGEGAAPDAPEAPADPGDAAPAGKAMKGKLVSLEQGDVACYVEVKTKKEELFLHGDFELCPGGGSDASGLIGQKVELKTDTQKVQADSCEGNPDCTDTQEVPFVVSVSAAK